MSNILMYVSIGSFVLAAACVILAVILFFRLDIRGVIGDLTGKTVAREVQTMRDQTKKSEVSHEKMQIPHGMTTSTNLSKSKMLDKRRKAKEEHKAGDLSNPDQNATTLLSQDSEATMLLTQDSEATTLLTQDSDATTLLSQESGSEMQAGDETTLLRGNDTRQKAAFTVCDSLVVIHTDEVIA